jgi:hypothetical protein
VVTSLQLQRLLDRAGISQRGAAKALDLNERTMRRYVAGEPIPRVVELAAKYLWEKSDANRQA